MAKDRPEQDTLSIDLDDCLDMDAFDWGNALDPVNIDWGFSAAMPEKTGSKQGKALAVNAAKKQQKTGWPVLVKTHVVKQSER